LTAIDTAKTGQKNPARVEVHPDGIVTFNSEGDEESRIAFVWDERNESGGNSNNYTICIDKEAFNVALRQARSRGWAAGYQVGMAEA
jgi:hypothetical protein